MNENKSLFKTYKILSTLTIIAVLLVIVSLILILFVNKKTPINVSNNNEVGNKEEISQYDKDMQLAVNYYRQGQIGKAIEYYQKAAQDNPASYVPYSNLGVIYQSQKDYNKAEESFKKALTIAPDATTVYYKLYELYFYDLKKTPIQIGEFFKDALEKTHNDLDIAKLEASYLEEIKNYDSALTVWKSILTLDPNNQDYKNKVSQLEKLINNN